MRKLLMLAALSLAVVPLSACGDRVGDVTSNGTYPAGGGSDGGTYEPQMPVQDNVSPLKATDATAAAPATLDQRAALGVTLAYTAAARAASLSIQTGLVSDPATIKRIGELDRSAKQKVDLVNLAFTTRNALRYNAALDEARAATLSLLNASGKPK